MPGPIGASQCLPNHKMTTLHGFYARRVQGEFCGHALSSGGRCSFFSRLSVASSPRQGSLTPRLCQTLLIPHFPLSLPFPRRNNPALRQKVQGRQDSVLGAIRRHCCQTRLGAAHELTAANAIYKSDSFHTAAICGKSVTHLFSAIASLGFIILIALFT